MSSILKIRELLFLGSEEKINKQAVKLVLVQFHMDSKTSKADKWRSVLDKENFTLCTTCPTTTWKSLFDTRLWHF